MYQPHDPSADSGFSQPESGVVAGSAYPSRYSDSMIDRLREHLRTTGLIPSGVSVLVGYSGGADSTAMLHLLKELGADVVAGHLHHGQRPEADSEMEQCAAFAEKLGIPFVSGRADVPAMSSQLGIGLEEAGRKARYTFFESAALQTNCGLIATAHTMDDHLETVIMNLIRGSGLQGVRGIPERRGQIVRPMLPFTRLELRDYCVSHGFWFHDDPANSDTEFARTRIRMNVVPELEKVQPGVRENVARFSKIVAADDELLDAIATRDLERTEVELNTPLGFLTQSFEAALDREGFAHAHPALINRGVRLVSSYLGGQLEMQQVEQIRKAIQHGEKLSITAPGGEIEVVVSEDRVHFRALNPCEPYRTSVAAPGITDSEVLGWAFEVRLLRQEEWDPAWIGRDPLEAFLDAEVVKLPMHVRSSNEGDRMEPIGLNGSKKISNIYREMGLTRAARTALPLLCDLGGILWVPGGPVSERCKVSEQASNIWAVRFRAFDEEGGSV